MGLVKEVGGDLNNDTSSVIAALIILSPLSKTISICDGLDAERMIINRLRPLGPLFF